MTIGENIKKYRKMKKMTQKQLSDLINKGIRTLQKYENDDITPPIKVLYDIAYALQVPIKNIIGNGNNIVYEELPGGYRIIDKTVMIVNDYLANTKYNPANDGIVDPRIFRQGLARTGKTLEKVSEETGVNIKVLESIKNNRLEIVPKDKIKLLALALSVGISVLLLEEEKAFVNIETMDLILKGEKLSALDNPITNLRSALYEYLKYREINNDIIDSKINSILAIIEGITNIL